MPDAMHVDITREARGRLRAEVIDLLVVIDKLGMSPTIFVRHPGYRKALEHLSLSTFLVDHLEAAQYFVVAFKHLFPGFGLRQDLINATSAAAIGPWTYEPYNDVGQPVGVQLEDGMELVFCGESPLAAIVRMLRLMVPVREQILEAGEADPNDGWKSIAHESRIDAIRICRNVTGCTLVQAKRTVEGWLLENAPPMSTDLRDLPDEFVVVEDEADRSPPAVRDA